jgi:hypothetical protein
LAIIWGRLPPKPVYGVVQVLGQFRLALDTRIDPKHSKYSRVFGTYANVSFDVVFGAKTCAKAGDN